MRCVMTRVLPVPGPARTRRGPSTFSTALRCCALRLLSMSDICGCCVCLILPSDAGRLAHDVKIRIATNRRDQAVEGIERARQLLGQVNPVPRVCLLKVRIDADTGTLQTAPGGL